MAGTVTAVYSNVGGGTNAVKCEFTWVSDGSGAVSGSVLMLPAGSILNVEFIPGTGSSQPTDLYDVDMLTPAGVSIFDDGTGTSIGANLSNANASVKVPFISGSSTTYVRSWIPGGTAYQLTVANAGSTKAGKVIIDIAPMAV